ncbi:MAG: SusC/RagA family TonB-linked outer membrane protein [Chitinophagia bacterium]|nr:SusC/RagA family TonB-linked outer membrane protein [Chitinophagia bacterium]
MAIFIGKSGSLFLFFILTFCGTSFAQSVSVKGRVTDSVSKEVLVGVTITVVGRNLSTLTDGSGEFSLVCERSERLKVTASGYREVTIPLSGEALSIMLVRETQQLEDVVVTALGRSSQRKSLGYSIQEVKGDALVQARETNLVNSLAGRVAGVNVVGGSNSIGGSSRIVIRGETSLAGNNQPLFVVDGIPINNNISASSQRQNIDYGNGAGDINPDDIETISVLKGPTAAALYGSRASNGVVLITTKKGSKSRGIGVSVNSTTTLENVLRLPTYQNEYGQGRGGIYVIGDGGRSWGPKLDGRKMAIPVNTEWTPRVGETVDWVPYPSNVEDFYETGYTYSNNVAVSGGNELGQYRFSYTNLFQKGMVPNTDQRRDNVALNAGMKLTDKLSINTSINYIDIASKNRPVVSYGNESVVYTWIWEGRQVRTDKMRDYWVKGLEGLQPFTYNYQFNDNPYYTMYENLNGYQKGRWIGNVNLTYQFNENLSLLVRTGIDQSNERRDSRRTPGSNAFPLGMYRLDKILFQERNSDFLLSYQKRMTRDWDVKVSLGGNTMSQREEDLSSIAGQLSVPGIYNLGNSRIPLVNQQYDSRYSINSFYGYSQLTYKNALFLDVTARNDWSSSLPSRNNSYFYPSVSFSGVFSDLFDIKRSGGLSFGKLRASWARVGNDTRPYRLKNVYAYSTPWQSFQAVSEPSSIANAGLLPEMLDTYELGMNLQFFKNRLGLDVTYYNTVSKNQILNVPIDLTSGYTSRFLNAGEIRSRGIEVMLNAVPLKTKTFRWNVNVNWSANRAKVIELIEGINTYALPSRYVSVQARVGERMGDMYGRGFQRDPQGNIIHANGVPLLTSELLKLGNYNPDWMAGIKNEFTYKGITASALFDWKMGGAIYSYMYVRGNEAGQLIESLPGRDNGYVGKGVVKNPDGSFSPNTVNITAERYWGSGYFNPEQSTFDATFVKLRELKIGYTIPSRAIARLGLREFSLMLVGRNLALWTDVPHIDPDTSGISGENILPGIEDMTLPSAKSLGINLSFKF